MMANGFRQKVLNVVSKIKRGRVLSYREVAELAGRPRAWRAVGNILNKNYDPRIPCHRVVRSDGKAGLPRRRVKAGGYNRGARKKRMLLQKEGAIR